MSSNQAHSHSASASASYNNHLSPTRLSRDRSLSASRPSSRTSARSGRVSPFIEDPITLRSEISEHKHLIRQKAARLTELEKHRVSARYHYNSEYSEDMTASMSSSPPFISSLESTSGIPKDKRRSSYDVLADLAGPESSLPLPRRESNPTSFTPGDSIKEGIPALFNSTPAIQTHHKRLSSPTRTLSRIPIASVGNARALADDGSQSLSLPTRLTLSTSVATSGLSPHDSSDTSTTRSTSPGRLPSPELTPSPLMATNALLAATAATRRQSLTPGGTTKVLADLQTGVVNARNALENTKGQLRVSQRTVAQLTRQNEDLKEAKERLRLQNEGLNNVVTRKERLLQEVLERARKAEAEAATLKSQLKSETTTSKKTIRDMESALSESTTLSQKSEREYITLRDSIKGLTESWKTDTERLREEMKKREERWKTEAETIGAKYKKLLAEIKDVGKKRETIHLVRAEDEEARKKVEKAWVDEIQNMKEQLEKSTQHSEEAHQTARVLAAELARLRRLIQSASTSSLAAAAEAHGTEVAATEAESSLAAPRSS